MNPEFEELTGGQCMGSEHFCSDRKYKKELRICIRGTGCTGEVTQLHFKLLVANAWNVACLSKIESLHCCLMVVEEVTFLQKVPCSNLRPVVACSFSLA